MATGTRTKSSVRRLFMTFTGVCCLACTYDFDQFDSHLSGTSEGGFTSTSTPNGGMAGSASVGKGGATSLGGSASVGAAASTGGASATGGQSASNAGGAAGGSAQTGSCAGVLYEGVCWYLGAQGSSCQQVCTNHGQLASTIGSFVGTAIQGGSLAKCATLLGLLGVTGYPQDGSRTDGRGLGCHLYQLQYPWWLNSPNFSTTASMANAQLVCGCTE